MATKAVKRASTPTAPGPTEPKPGESRLTEPPRPRDPASEPAPDAGLALKHQLTASEKATVRRFAQRRKDSLSAPAVKVEQRGAAAGLRIEHADSTYGQILLQEALGTTDANFFNGMLHQLSIASSHGGKVDEGDLNFLLSTVKGIKPRDQLEAMLAAQMGIVQMSIAKFSRRLSNVETLPQQDSALNGLTKLMRTYTAQLEALKRYRTGGEQNVTVQHVTVSDGGQAIVGNVSQPPAPTPPARPSTAALTHSAQAPMPMLDVSSLTPVNAVRRSEDDA